MSDEQSSKIKLFGDSLTTEEFRAYTLAVEQLSLNGWIQHINEWDAEIRKFAARAPDLALEISYPTTEPPQTIIDHNGIQWELRDQPLKKPRGQAYVCSRLDQGEMEYAVLETGQDGSPDGNAFEAYAGYDADRVLQSYIYRELCLNRQGVEEFVSDTEKFLKSIVTCDCKRVLEAVRERFEAPDTPFLKQAEIRLFESPTSTPQKNVSMKTTSLLSLAAILLLGAGCAATRPISDVAIGAGGAALASKLSDGDPLITAAGAAGGVMVSEGLHYAARKESEKAYLNGYEKGRSDAVKQQYWLQVRQQRTQTDDPSVRLYEIPIPEQTIDGAILKPTSKYLRIEE